jgi:hypothetical protein
MPNSPKPAARKRTPPDDRQNAQGDHEGSPHRPEEFDQANPAKQVPQDHAGGGTVKPES